MVSPYHKWQAADHFPSRAAGLRDEQHLQTGHTSYLAYRPHKESEVQTASPRLSSFTTGTGHFPDGGVLSPDLLTAPVPLFPSHRLIYNLGTFPSCWIPDAHGIFQDLVV